MDDPWKLYAKWNTPYVFICVRYLEWANLERQSRDSCQGVLRAGQRNGDLLLITRRFWGGDKNVLEIDCGDGCTTQSKKPLNHTLQMSKL